MLELSWVVTRKRTGQRVKWVSSICLSPYVANAIFCQALLWHDRGESIPRHAQRRSSITVLAVFFSHISQRVSVCERDYALGYLVITLSQTLV